MKLLLLFVLLCACGAPPEDISVTTAAVNGYSVPPSGGWGTEPWICSGPVGTHPAWVPTSYPWPMNTTNSWCQWQPSPTAGMYPYHVSTCSWSPDPVWNGTAYLYSEPGYGGSCALVYGDGTTPYGYDADLVEVNGWHSIWTPTGGTQQFAGIKSIKFGPHTGASLCAGPLTGPTSNPCNAYHSIGVGTGTTGTSWTAMIDPNGGLFFETAAFQIWATQ